MFTHTSPTDHWSLWSPLPVPNPSGQSANKFELIFRNSVTKLSFFWNGLYSLQTNMCCPLPFKFRSFFPANVFDTLSLFAFVSSIHFCRRRPLLQLLYYVFFFSVSFGIFTLFITLGTFGVCECVYVYIWVSRAICILHSDPVLIYIYVYVYHLTARIYSFKQFYSFHFRCMAAWILFHFIFSCCSFAGFRLFLFNSIL